MAYNPFDNSKPVIGDDGNIVIDEVRENLMALRDAVVAGGASLKDFDLAVSGGTPEEPTTHIYTHKVDTNIKVKCVVVWGTAGGSLGSITSAALSLSVDSGAVYDPIGTKTFTYDVNGNLTGATWS